MNKKRGQKLFLCFVDLKKAFDTIARDLLMYKITQSNINGNFFDVLKDMYAKSLAKITINKLLSPDFGISKGTEQGHPMSPELFKLFIKDLSHDLEYNNDSFSFPILVDTIITHLLWADDLVLLALDEKSLQKNLDILHGYCEKWGLSVNMKKTKMIVIGNRTKKESLPKFKLGSDLVDYSDEYCYLGVIIHENGNFKSATNELRKKALRALYGLKRVIERDSLSFDALIKLFDSLIKPILLYGCQVITPHTLTARNIAGIYSANQKEKPIHKITESSNSQIKPENQLYINTLSIDTYENFHLKFLKWCFGIHRNASNLGVWGDSGRYPLIFNAIKLSTDYYECIRYMPDCALVKKAFIEQKNLNLDWFKTSSSIFENFGTGKSKRASVNVTINLQNQFINHWKASVAMSPKLEFYNTIKEQFQREKYLKIKVFNCRSALTKLRISAHNLEIETGRYTKPITSRGYRFCQLCNLSNNIQVADSEQHALLVCHTFKHLRKKLVEEKIIGNTLRETFEICDDTSKLSRLGKFCNTIFDVHFACNTYSKLDECSSERKCVIL